MVIASLESPTRYYLTVYPNMQVESMVDGSINSNEENGMLPGICGNTKMKHCTMGHRPNSRSYTQWLMHRSGNYMTGAQYKTL